MKRRVCLDSCAAFDKLEQGPAGYFNFQFDIARSFFAQICAALNTAGFFSYAIHFRDLGTC